MTKKLSAAVVLCFLTLVLGVCGFVGVSGYTQSVACDGTTASSSCGRCGDGQCVKSCGENARTCPADCGVPSSTK